MDARRGWAAWLTGALWCMALMPTAAMAQVVGPIPGMTQEKQQAPEAPTAKQGELAPLADVQVFGEGPNDVVLLPFLGLEAEAYAPMLERNADLCTFHVVTMPGYEGSLRPYTPEDDTFRRQPWTINAVEAVAAYIRESDLDRPIVLGHWNGAVLGFQLALTHPDLVGPIVALDGGPELAVGAPGTQVEEARRYRIIDRMSRERITQEFWQSLAHTSLARGLSTDPERQKVLGDMLAASPWPVIRRYWIESFGLVLTDEVAALDQRVLGIIRLPTEGPAEGIRAEANRVFDAIPDARLVFITSEAQLVFDTHAKTFDEAFRTFVKGEPVPGAASPTSDESADDGPVDGDEVPDAGDGEDSGA